MARFLFGGKEIELPDSESWTIAELSEAEHAMGTSFGDNSQADSMAIAFFVAVRRVDKEMPAVLLADSIRQIPMSALLMDEAEPPLATDTSPGDPLNSGPRRLEASG